jgi:signal transduction histidine kinase
MRGTGGNGERRGGPAAAQLRERERDAIDELLHAERRRIAADVHDLVMQDLSFALSRTRAIGDNPADAADLAQAATQAGERALHAARRMLAELDEDDPRGNPREAVEQAARHAARGVDISFEASGVAGGWADALTIHVLVHVAREAVTNAVKHADPSRLAVVLAHDREWRLVVSDDGSGLDPEPDGDGFGIASMRRQAEFLGGRLSILGTPGVGTIVELALP